MLHYKGGQNTLDEIWTPSLRLTPFELIEVCFKQFVLSLLLLWEWEVINPHRNLTER